DRLVSRTELLEQFWEGRDVYDDSMRKAIGAIRKALNDKATQPRFIETRRSGGYRYIGPFEARAESLFSESLKATSAVEAESLSGVRIVIEEETNNPAPMFTAVEQLASSQPKSRLPKLAPRTKMVSIFGLSMLVVTSLLMFSRDKSKREIDALPTRSIAVLPFKNLSGNASQDYFGDGVTETLINELSKIRDLKVIARTSAFAFKGKETDVREIGRRLGVAAVLEGSLRRDAETVRVTVRLVSTEDARILWTGDLTRPLKDILIAQDEIGCSVAESLKTILCRDLKYHPGTINLTAYEAYLKGRDRRVKGDPKAAAEFYQQAISADPDYPLAWAGLAEAYTVLEVNSLVPPRSVAGKARESALKAIALDDSLAAPYAALGLLTAFSDRDWATGERYLQQALAINPNYAIAHAWYGNTLMVQGKFAEAERQYLHARELDPLNPGFLNNLAETYHYWQQPDRCLVQAAKALELDPANEWARFNQAKCYLALGRYDEAMQISLDAKYKNLMQAGVFALSDRQREAQKLLPLILKDWGHISPYIIASLYARLGEKDAAFDWLQKAADQQQADLVSLKIEPNFDVLRTDPRFAELLRRIGL
ncbi:MAG TPA: FlgO family outer membrane protein, partial [Blastocatellia bacterium]|nr:FlgO family outer membrane protein [Blastocatellia bacterium]